MGIDVDGELLLDIKYFGKFCSGEGSLYFVWIYRKKRVFLFEDCMKNYCGSSMNILLITLHLMGKSSKEWVYSKHLLMETFFKFRTLEHLTDFRYFSNLDIEIYRPWTLINIDKNIICSLTTLNPWNSTATTCLDNVQQSTSQVYRINTMQTNSADFQIACKYYLTPILATLMKSPQITNTIYELQICDLQNYQINLEFAAFST